MQTKREPVIYLRTTIKWASMTRTAFAKQTLSGKSVRVIKAIIDKHLLDVWDAAFALNFFTFRARLQQMSEQSLRETGLRVLRGPEQLRSELASGKPLLIAPTDDDDLYNPALGKQLAVATASVIAWPNWFLRRGKVIPRKAAQNFPTNAYALCSSIIRRVGTAPLMQHGIARDRVRAYGTRWLPTRLSATNKTIGSARQLLEIATRPEAIELLRDCVELTISRPIPPDVPDWLLPYLRSTQELHRELLNC
jgi:hypothetical protein